MTRFLVEGVTKKDIKELRELLVNSDVDTSDMDDEDVLREAFGYIEFGRYGEWDVRDHLRVRKTREE